MRRHLSPVVAALAAVAVAVVTVSAASPVHAADRFPTVIDLPDGLAPEGVAIDRTVAYTGSLLTGAIEAIDLATGQTTQFAPPPGPGKIAVGMDVGPDGRLWVAGGGGGLIPGTTAGYRVYDTDTGDLVVDVELPNAGFVNDVIVTRDAAWFTDSVLPVVHRVPISRDGSIGNTDTVALGGEWEQSAGINGNGIVATADGRHLVIAQLTAPDGWGSAIYVADARSNGATLDAIRIDLDADLAVADGLVLTGRTLYAVGSPAGVVKIRLGADLTAGRIVAVIATDGIVSPTTADVFGASLYVVDANFPALGDPTSAHTLTAIRR